MMAKLFESSSQARFEWKGWATVRGKRMATFSYSIDGGHSSYSISYNDQQRIITAYGGVSAMPIPALLLESSLTRSTSPAPSLYKRRRTFWITVKWRLAAALLFVR